MRRFAASAARLALPPFCTHELLACLKALLRTEAAWVPGSAAAAKTAASSTSPSFVSRAAAAAAAAAAVPDGFSLYIRPALMATTPFLGVGPPSDASLFVVLSPCGPYLSAQSKNGNGKSSSGVRLFLDEALVRAAPGGVGNVKIGGNYAPTVAPARAAAATHAAAQVLFTAPDARANAATGARCVAEAGAMNVFFLISPSVCDDLSLRDELVTPPLDGTILPGVTRQSVLELCRDAGARAMGVRVSERPLCVDELAAAARQGRLREIFATGTAAVVMPIDALVRADGSELRTSPLRRAGAQPQPLSARVAAALADIQYGRVPHEWSVSIEA
jgi:branched-subunit amino acid aminotransferase/4-amino-4-deoxychorismate lyase